jgi:glycosyltransferase involved in cell wall biosynthesis
MKKKIRRREQAQMAEPLVSIIIPAFNRERYLAQAIESVLAQTYRPIEIIVADDGSVDNSADIAKGFSDRVRYFYQPNSGCGAARNTGVVKARGSFLAFLDSDDLWVEEKLFWQMEILRSDKGLDMVFGHVEHFYSQDLDQSARERFVCPAEKMPGYLAGTLLISREAFLRAGFFDIRLDVGEFLDWYGKARDKGLKEVMLPEVVLRRRIHGSNTVIRKRDSQTDYIRALKGILDRRRKDG